jgi:hypothetical protein
MVCRDQILAGTDASMMARAETPEARKQHKNPPEYWVNRDHPVAAARKKVVTDAAK